MLLGDKYKGLEGTKVSPSVAATNLIGGGAVNSVVGKSSKVLGLNHFTTSGETGVSKLSPSKPRIGRKKSVGKLPKFKIFETPTVCIIGESEKITRVCKKIMKIIRKKWYISGGTFVSSLSLSDNFLWVSSRHC
jgi:hypothetical protein